MKAIVILAMIPLGIAATFLPEPKSPYTGPVKVQAEEVHTFNQRFEPVYPIHTFEERWWPGEGLPVARGIPLSDVSSPKVVKTIRITKALPEPPEEVTPAPVRRAKPRPIRVADICQRHGMHKVHYGRTWRCRR